MTQQKGFYRPQTDHHQIKQRRHDDCGSLTPTSQVRIPVTCKATSLQLLLLGSSLLQLEAVLRALGFWIWSRCGPAGWTAPSQLQPTHVGGRGHRAHGSHISQGETTTTAKSSWLQSHTTPSIQYLCLLLAGWSVTQQYFTARQQKTNAHHKAPRQC